jgi:orotidine-5'-phosphate decarboxylase
MANQFRETIQTPEDRVIVALDNMGWKEALTTMSEVSDHVGMGKANSLAQKEGWEHATGQLRSVGAKMMADTKFHDIPKTVELQVEAVASCEPRLITIHASGGEEMLKSAVTGRDRGVLQSKSFTHYELVAPQVGLLGITVLTSLGEEARDIYGKPAEEKVLEFARFALNAGLEGIVCSGKELKAIRANSELDDLITVVPGITPEWTKKAGDQKRVVTPSEAIQSGADYIVVGRAITEPPEGISRAEAAERIAQEVAEAL